MSKILWMDDDLCVVHKSAGVLVHRRPGRRDRNEPALLLQLREETGRLLYPVHRLDRATSGVMVFAFSSDIAANLCGQFRDHAVRKRYRALVRGWVPGERVLDRPLRRRTRAGVCVEETVTAVTRVVPRQCFDIPMPSGPYATTRCCLVDVFPQSGRWHQIRRHLNHAAHPVVGDVEHGDNSRNHFFRKQFELRRLMLAATGLHFRHPRDDRELSWECDPTADFQSLVDDVQPYAVSAAEVSAGG